MHVVPFHTKPVEQAHEALVGPGPEKPRTPRMAVLLLMMLQVEVKPALPGCSLQLEVPLAKG